MKLENKEIHRRTRKAIALGIAHYGIPGELPRQNSETSLTKSLKVHCEFYTEDYVQNKVLTVRDKKYFC